MAWLAGLGLCAAACAPALAEEDWGGGPPCQQVAGQVMIDGVPQQVVGLACLQPDGTWQIVDSTGTEAGYYPMPYYPDYYYDPWYWAPVAVGFGATFIFIDHHHHVHPMHHVFFRRGGMVGFHGAGAARGFRPVAPGGFHGGTGGMHGGGFHGGTGGMHH